MYAKRKLILAYLHICRYQLMMLLFNF